MTKVNSNDDGAPSVLAEHVGYLVAIAGRAPSVHNTQPWRFAVSGEAIELRADAGRQLRLDPDGREMVISCGAALYGLRLAVRSLGLRPEVELLPAPSVLARVRSGAPAPMTPDERKLLQALSRRHTHRGPFEPDPLPAPLFARLRDDAESEGATLAEIEPGPVHEELMALAAAVAGVQDRDPGARAETGWWSREVTSAARDGVPAHAFPAVPGRQAGRLPQRDFDLGRGFGLQPGDAPAPPVTAVLFTAGDGQEDWLRAGQALYRLLLHASTQWVFARLNTQPLEDAAARTLIRDRLSLPGAPQLLLAFGVSRMAQPTARRPAGDLIGP